MPAATPFDRFPGTSSARIRPAAGAIAGEFSFCLGSDRPDEAYDLATGDHAFIQQAVNVTTLAYIRFVARLRGPRQGPSRWLLTWRVDGVVQGSRRVPVGRTTQVTDAVFDVSQLTGVHTLEVRLEVTP